MRPVLIRILKNGLPTAAALAVVGYFMADVAGVWVANQGTSRTGAQVTTGEQDLAQVLRYRIPLTMAAWGFGIVTAYELLLGLLRRGKPAIPAPAKASPEDEAEKLLNELLKQADAAEAARAAQAKAVTDTPPPAGTTTPVPASAGTTHAG